LTNYSFFGKDTGANIAELVEIIKGIAVDNALVFEVRNELPEVFEIYPLNPPEGYPTNIYSYGGYAYRDGKTGRRMNVGEARAEYIHLGKDLGSLEAKIRQDMFVVATVASNTFEYENGSEAEVLLFHQLLNERLDGWLEQKVSEKRAYRCGI
jgi:hypothetical protein